MSSRGQTNLTLSQDIDTTYDYFESSTQFLLLVSFQTYLPPFFIALGSLGNLSSFLTLQRPALARHSMAFYLLSYVVVSSAYLYASCGLDWLSHITGLPNVSHLADWTCRLWKFVFGVVRHSVDWLLVAMVTDRVIATRRALAAYRSTICTPFVARVATISVFVGLTVIAIHAMWIYGLAREPDGSCGIDQRQKDLGSIAWPWLSAVILSYIPDTLVLLLAPLLTIEYVCGLCSTRNPSDDDESSVNRNDAEDAIQSGFTLCCICTAFTFLLCTVPANFVNIFWYIRPPDLLTWYASVATCSMVTCVQSGVTFVWCYMCVENIRRELWAMLGEFYEHCSRKCRRAEEIYAEVNIDQEENAENTDDTMV